MPTDTSLSERLKKLGERLRAKGVPEIDTTPIKNGCIQDGCGAPQCFCPECEYGDGYLEAFIAPSYEIKVVTCPTCKTRFRACV